MSKNKGAQQQFRATQTKTPVSYTVGKHVDRHRGRHRARTQPVRQLV